VTVTPAPASPGGAPPALDPVSMVRSKAYLSALVLAGLLGIPISAIAYGFLALVGYLQKHIFQDWPSSIFTTSRVPSSGRKVLTPINGSEPSCLRCS